MPTDNQPAKSYIATVLARVDGATALKPCPFCGETPRGEWIHSDAPGMEDCGYWSTGCGDPGRVHPGLCVDAHGGTRGESEAAWNHRCQDIPTLGKIALRAIDQLEACKTALFGSSFVQLFRDTKDALADINALAAKGSQ